MGYPTIVPTKQTYDTTIATKVTYETTHISAGTDDTTTVAPEGTDTVTIDPEATNDTVTDVPGDTDLTTDDTVTIGPEDIDKTTNDSVTVGPEEPVATVTTAPGETSESTTAQTAPTDKEDFSDCIVEGQQYKDGSSVPLTSDCQESCRCDNGSRARLLGAVCRASLAAIRRAGFREGSVMAAPGTLCQTTSMYCLSLGGRIPKRHFYLPGQFLKLYSHQIVEPCVLWDPRSLQAHGFESFPRSECRLDFLTWGKGFLAVSDAGDEEPFERLAHRMMDISGDGGVLKMEVKAGVGEAIPERASVTFHYTAFLEHNDEPFDSSLLRGFPDRKLLDVGELLPGLNLAIKTMRCGETSRFLIWPHYAFGKTGCPPRIPGGAVLLYEVQLVSAVDHAAADSFQDLDVEKQNTTTFKEKLEAAQAYHRQVCSMFTP
ncbi:Inactive peptidyl-prolyl cis-trans isomerase FKBP6 [Portunus trituberculatus]|uniref:peptidylprolyl isomerase n=1 Tax=Portunus trituberculatus TaxID=210409 RepID=A0A5B7EUL6_PORTR|nr:Inactive peptidyl-prolyl cis-trans isomerase FKBP6 [Portunus trituberculatus]